jgi:SAM-dependent methyltransferase
MIIDAQLLEKLICINCNNPALRQRENELVCSACGKNITLNHGIPDFLLTTDTTAPARDKSGPGSAIGYEHCISGAIAPYRLSRIDRPMLQYAKGDVLEIGCGTCRLARDVEKSGARYFGVDPNFSYLQYASNLRGLRRLVRATGERLPFQNGSFDYIISGYLAYSAVKAELGLPEARRVLRPGGKFVFDLLNHWVFKFLELKRHIRNGELSLLRSFRSRPSSNIFEFVNVSGLRKKTEKAGFLIEDLISTPIIPIALFSFIDLNKYLSNSYFRGKRTVYLGYDVIIILRAL